MRVMDNVGTLDSSGARVSLDEILKGSVDLHHHHFPEFSLDHPTRMDDEEELRLAAEAGMAGILFKSHFFPTVGAAYRINRRGLQAEAYSSVTLNPCCGGLSPLAVEIAARQGARAVFMPTWSAASDIRRGGISKYLSKQ